MEHDVGVSRKNGKQWRINSQHLSNLWWKAYLIEAIFVLRLKGVPGLDVILASYPEAECVFYFSLPRSTCSQGS